MVSTRGVKLKFIEGERVLCYEPDPTKAKVLYNSKVLDVITHKDQRGRKTHEYLIHFQGWNSSWDRCVSEDFVLKDTPENRQLQKDLAEKAQLQLGAYLYRRERKKRTLKLSERIALSSEDGSSGSPAPMDVEEAHCDTTTSDTGSSDEETIMLELTAALKNCLEHDNYLIHTKNKLPKLPAEPTVIAILESYWKYYATKELCIINEKPNTRSRPSFSYSHNSNKSDTEQVYKNLNICKEMLDGLRIYFDFTLNDLLLYKQEQGQTKTKQAVNLDITGVKQEVIKIKVEPEDPDSQNHHMHVDIEENEKRNADSLPCRRWLRSQRNNTDADRNGIGSPSNDIVIKQEPLQNSPVNSRTTPEPTSPFNNILSWQILPDYVYKQDILPPSLLYGATHLTRLLVKLPELLYSSSIPEDKLKVLLTNLSYFVDFLSEHREWYGDRHYIDSSKVN